MKQSLLLLILLLWFYPPKATAQVYIDPYDGAILEEIIRGRLPGTRYEAMGRAEAVIGNSPSSIHANPAVLGRVQKYAFDASRAAPYYNVRTGRYNYLGGAVRVHKHWVVGLDWHRFNNNSSVWEFQVFNRDFPSEKPATGVVHFAVANNSIKNLSLGAALYILNWKYLHTMPVSHSYQFNFGALYDIHINKQDTAEKLILGASYSNINKAHVEFGAPGYPNLVGKEMPVTLKMGIGYQRDFNFQLGGFREKSRLTFTAEYKNLLNYTYETGYNTGAEMLFFNYLALRGGYYFWTTDDKNGSFFANHKGSTYGFGFKIPMGQLLHLYNGWTLDLDYTALPQKPFEDRSRYFNNFHSFGLRTSLPLGFKKIEQPKPAPVKQNAVKTPATPAKPGTPAKQSTPTKPNTPAKPKK